MTKNLISVVDDDEAIRRTTTFLIESFGFRAAAFDSAESFLKSVQLHDTSCLLVDVQMPGMNGLQFQRELAVAGCGIPIIFITAYDNKDTVSKRCKPAPLHSWTSPLATSNYSKLFVQPYGTTLVVRSPWADRFPRWISASRTLHLKPSASPSHHSGSTGGPELTSEYEVRTVTKRSRAIRIAET